MSRDKPAFGQITIHTYINTMAYSFVTQQDKNYILHRKRMRKKFPLLFEVYDDSVRDSDCFFYGGTDSTSDQGSGFIPDLIFRLVLRDYGIKFLHL